MSELPQWRKVAFGAGLTICCLPIPMLAIILKLSSNNRFPRDLHEVGLCLEASIVSCIVAASLAAFGQGRPRSVLMTISLIEAAFLYACGMGL